ncbi:unnamed protein product [Orchesella dallaii]|uniref:diacylglycerol O-acyltransferase n=1 Tax=Orchesella dallaii TaxID=48710 RepID=A0ABP1RD23_9HEXA
MKSLKLLQEIPALASGFAVLLGLIPLYLISTPVFILRLILIRISKVLRPDLENIVSATGNLFVADLFSRNSPRCVIVVPIVIEGFHTDDEFRRRIGDMANSKNYKEFKHYITHWNGFAFWTADRSFDVKNHVKFHESENKTAIDKDVSLLVERLLNKQFHPRRSPWEVYIIRNYEDPELKRGDKSVLVMRFHHSLADGYSILYAIIEGMLQSPISSVPLPEPNYVKRSNFDQFLFTLSLPFRLVYDATHYFGKQVSQSPWNIPDEKKKWKQLYGKSKHIPIERIKEIKTELNVSFTSVLLAAVSGSIARSFRSKRIMCSDSTSISCFIPLPLPGHPSGLKNHVTGAQISLPLQDDLNPIVRIRMCEELLQQQKSSTIPLLLHFLAQSLGLHFSSVSSFLTSNRVNAIGLTNFPAGNRDIKTGFGDEKVLAVDLAAGGLTGVTGVTFMAISYVDHIRFAVTAESAVMSREDVENLLQYVCDEIDLLHTLSIVQDS